jgi:hypothetical protein
MDLDAAARLRAIELVVTQLVAEHLRSVPDPAEQATRAVERLHATADAMPLDAASLDEEARLRVAIKTCVTDFLDAAVKLARAATAPARDWHKGYEGGS